MVAEEGHDVQQLRRAWEKGRVWVGMCGGDGVCVCEWAGVDNWGWCTAQLVAAPLQVVAALAGATQAPGPLVAPPACACLTRQSERLARSKMVLEL